MTKIESEGITEEALGFEIDPDELRLLQEGTLLVKMSGKTIDGGNIENILSQLSFLISKNIKIVLVHGAGPQLNSRLGPPTYDENHERITPPEKRDIVQQVDEVLTENLKLAAEKVGIKNIETINHQQLPAKDRGENNASGKLEVKKISEATKNQVEESDLTIIGHVGLDSETGNAVNVNADYVVGPLSSVVNPVKLIILGDTNGVWDAKKNTIPELKGRSHFAQLKEEGAIKGGMIPKISAMVDAAEHQPVYIMPEASEKHANHILEELLTTNGVPDISTMVTREESKSTWDQWGEDDKNQKNN